MELFEWMTSTTWGESLLTLLVSMVPVIELRGGVPFGTALGLAPLHALVVCIIGNMLPIPFIIVYIRRIFHWMRRRSPRLNALVDKLEKKAHLKGQKVTKYKYIGLWLFVAIPLPGTGAWTGALIAALLDDLAEDGPVHFSQEPVGTLSAHTGEGSLQNFQQPFEVLPAAHIGEGPRRYRDECSAVVLSKRSKA